MPLLACNAHGQYMFPVCLSNLSPRLQDWSENPVNDQCPIYTAGIESELGAMQM